MFIKWSGGGTWIRTRDEGSAVLRLATWLCRLGKTPDKVSRVCTRSRPGTSHTSLRLALSLIAFGRLASWHPRAKGKSKENVKIYEHNFCSILMRKIQSSYFGPLCVFVGNRRSVSTLRQTYLCLVTSSKRESRASLSLAQLHVGKVPPRSHRKTINYSVPCNCHLFF